MSAVRKLRRFAFSLVALGAHVVQTCRDRLTGKTLALPNFTQLEPCLYIGGHCLSPPPGVRAVLCLTPNHDPFTAEFHAHRPFPTAAVPPLAWLREQVEFIHQHVSHNIPTFVHCDAGMDRSATIIVAYLMWRDHASRDDVLETIRRKRAVNPNPAFMALLNAWRENLPQLPITI
jgi:hypothetical protein